MGTLQQICALVVGEMWGLRFLNVLLSGRMWGLRFCSTEMRLMARWWRRRRGCVLKSSVFCLSNRPSVNNLYIFVGISNFKIPLCIYYCLQRSLLKVNRSSFVSDTEEAVSL